MAYKYMESSIRRANGLQMDCGIWIKGAGIDLWSATTPPKLTLQDSRVAISHHIRDVLSRSLKRSQKSCGGPLVFLDSSRVVRLSATRIRSTADKGIGIRFH